MKWINYQHLFYFWNVARYGSVTKASKALRLAQPTVSAQLRTLEDVLGESLFERTGRNLQLTDAGKITLRYAEQIFNLGDELLENLSGHPQSYKELNVGISDVVPKTLAYKIVRPAFRNQDNTRLVCYEDKTERLLADLAISEIDLVIADRPIPPSAKVNAFNHILGESGVTLLANKSLADKYRRGFPGSLQHAPLILPTREAQIENELIQWLAKNDITVKSPASFQDRAMMKIAAKDGVGIIPIPTVIEKEVCRDFKLAVVGRITEIREKYYLVTLERRIRNNVVSKIFTEAQKKIF